MVTDSTYTMAKDGTTDDRAAIQNYIDAASAGDDLWFPPGTYRIGNTVNMKSGVGLYGVPGQSTIYMSTQGSPTAGFYSTSATGVVLDGLRFLGDGPYANFYAVSMSGQTNSVLRRLSFVDCRFAVKLGGGNLSTGWTVEDITISESRSPFYVQDVHDSLFQRIQITGTHNANAGDYPVDLYIDSNVQNSTFTDLYLDDAIGYAFQIHANQNTGNSSGLVFRRVYADVADYGGNNGIAIANGSSSQVSNVDIYDLELVANHTWDDIACWWTGASDVIVDGFQISGMNYMVYGSGPSASIFRNGNYDGANYFYPGSTGVTIEGTVTRNGTAYSVTAPELPRG